MSPIVHLDYLRLERGQIQTRTLTVHGTIVINQFVCEQRLQFKLVLHALSYMYHNRYACVCCVSTLSRITPIQHSSRFGTMTAHQLTAKCTNIMTQWHKSTERKTH